MIKKRQQGFTMLEMIITVGILSIGILGIYGAFSPLVEKNYVTTLQFKATYLAQEGFEIVRNIRDNNIEKGRFWSSGLSDCASGCQADYKTETTAALPVNYLNNYRDEFLKLNADGFYSYDRNGNESVYKRKITITQPSGSDMLKVLVEVFWNYNNQSYRVENVGYLYRFNR